MWRAWVPVLTAAVTLVLFGSSAARSQMPKGKDLDRQHEDLLRDFAARAHKLALQYEQAGSHDKAKDTLQLILQIAPDNKEARALLDKISKQELAENKKTLKVLANKSWQDTGLQVFEDKPVAIEVKGDWVFKMSRVVTAEGIEMPEDMKKFPLGSLIGVIDVSDAPAKKEARKEATRPFLIGSQKVFTPSASGVLYLKMHDSEEADNQGSLTVTISGQVREH
jgi:hypothetical protein